MARVMSRIVQFFLSTTPFCRGVYGIEKCLCIPCSLQKEINSLEVNSPLLSVLRQISFNSFSLSACALKLLKASNASNFCFNRETHSILVQSSTSRRKYLLPPRVSRAKGPQRSPWISSSGLEALNLADEGNNFLTCLQVTQLEHSSSHL